MNSSQNSWASHLFGCPNEKGSSEITNKDVALSLLDQLTSQSIIWDRLHHDLQVDHEIALRALKNRCMPSSIEEWPLELQSDRVFWKSVLQTCRWTGPLPLELLNDVEFIRSIPKWQSEEQIRLIFNQHVDLRNDPNMWIVIVDSSIVSVDFWFEFAHDFSILENKAVMLHAVLHDYSIYDVLYAPLNQDEDIVRAALRQSGDALIYIPAFVQRLYPNEVATSIRNWTTSVPSRSEQLPEGYRQFYLDAQPDRKPNVHNALWIEYVGAELWTNRDVALAWASIGGNYRKSFPACFKNDADLFLLIARYNWSDFSKASAALKSDKAFMRKAIEENGSLILDAEGVLQNDFDLAIIAFSHSSNLMIAYDYDQHSDFDDFQFLNNLQLHIAGKLQEYAAFELIMLSIFGSSRESMNPGESSFCPLVSLNQGRETTKIYIHLLKAYLGVPTEKELMQLRMAQQNIRL